MRAEEIDALLRLDPAWEASIRARWRALMDIVVWGDLRATSLGGAGKVRKRVLDLGEKWRSLFNDRSWIPHPRERLKNALGSSLNLRDSLLMLERAAKDIEGGGDYAEFERLLIGLHRETLEILQEKENRWAQALDRVNREALDEPE